MSTSTYDPTLPSPRSTMVDAANTSIGGSHIHRRISWAAIFGGVIIVVAIQILLAMLGAGIGLGTVSVNAGNTPGASSLCSNLSQRLQWATGALALGAVVFGQRKMQNA